jgi:hypothetical protein
MVPLPLLQHLVHKYSLRVIRHIGDGSAENRAGSLLEIRITLTPSPGAPADR